MGSWTASIAEITYSYRSGGAVISAILAALRYCFSKHSNRVYRLEFVRTKHTPARPVWYNENFTPSKWRCFFLFTHHIVGLPVFWIAIALCEDDGRRRRRQRVEVLSGYLYSHLCATQCQQAVIQQHSKIIKNTVLADAWPSAYITWIVDKWVFVIVSWLVDSGEIQVTSLEIVTSVLSIIGSRFLAVPFHPSHI